MVFSVDALELIEMRRQELWSEPARGAKFSFRELIALLFFLRGNEQLNRGTRVTKFENAIGDFLGSSNVVATTSCSSALSLVPKIIGLNKGDEVLVPINSFWTSVAPLFSLGIIPVPYDVNPQDLSGNIVDASSKITSKTRAIYVQSFGGSPYDGPGFRSLCDERGLKLVEDSAHGLGAQIGSVKIQKFSDISCLSFSTLKNVVTLGEGGAVVTDSEQFASKARQLIESRAIGNFREYQTPRQSPYLELINLVGYDFMRIGDAFLGEWEDVYTIGSTLRISAPQALLGSLQVTRYEKTLMARRKQCLTYRKELSILENGAASVFENCQNSAHHLFILNVFDHKLRNKILINLRESLNYRVVNRYIPISIQSVSRYFGMKHPENSIYEKLLLNNMISLPIGPGLSKKRQSQIIKCINDVYAKSA